MPDQELTGLERFLASVRERANEATGHFLADDVFALAALVDQMRHGLLTVHWMVRGSVEGRASSLREPIESATAEAMQYPPDPMWMEHR